MQPTQHRNRGFALLGVLWTGVVLGLLAGAVSDVSQGDVELARSLREVARAEAAADGAVSLAVHALLQGDSRDDAFTADGAVIAWRRDDLELRVRIDAETARLSLNGAGEDDIAALLQEEGIDADAAARLAAAIADYRDEDDLSRPGGAEDDDYRRAGAPLGAKDAPFEAVEELAAVLGFDADLAARVAERVSLVDAGRRAVARNPDGPASETMTGPPAPAFALPLTDEPEQIAPGADPVPTAGLLRVRGEAATAGGARFARVAVVAVGRGGDVEMRRWDRARPALFP